ncbi:MAG TPA: ATP-dependent zinc metalloprotease FtsH, partial [Gemmataceae bacterium]|nr:ATP-dependent zinc metalloprotease FtsH [Gemmataceae bacterium]
KERGAAPWLAPPAMVALAVLAVIGVYLFLSHEPAVLLKYGEFKQILLDKSVTFQNVRVGRSEIRGEIVTHDTITGALSSKEPAKPVVFHTPRAGLENDADLQRSLDQRVGHAYQADDEDSMVRSVSSFVSVFFLTGLLIVIAIFMFRWLAGANSPLTFGRSRHKLYAQKDLGVTFVDVAGIDEAVTELREVVEFLKTPQKYQALGGRIPKGVLLVGPPGTGKTLLAKAVAGEADVAFFGMSGSDFVEMFVGVGAARVRDLFAQAEGRAPCIIFIDELDALGKSRGANVIGGHDEREQTLNQLLVEMDGFDSNRGVIIMAATNRPEILDAALLRPGRFDRTVVVDRPDIVGREAILKVHTRSVRLGDDVDLRHVASLTPGSVGADLANLVNEAALMAARRDKKAVAMAEFEEAVERGAVGLERKSRIMKDDEKQRVAYHEAGHALVACALPNTDPVHKVSIIPRGIGALGYVLSRPEDDRYLMTRSQLESNIKVALGGTIAEELVFHEISNGATSDLEKVSRIARNMVKEFGMSRLGRIYFRDEPAPAYLAGPPYGESSGDYSEHTAREIDMEVRKIIDDATEEVRSILKSRRPALEALAKILVEKEVIDGGELRKLLDENDPGPKLVPASAAVETTPHLSTNGQVVAAAVERKAE